LRTIRNRVLAKRGVSRAISSGASDAYYFNEE
jgi:hypothetical protein